MSRPTNEIIFECDCCKNQFTSKHGLQRHKTLKHGTSKWSNKTKREAVATSSNDFTHDPPLDSTWYDPPTTIAHQFVTLILQKQQTIDEDQSSPMKELLEQSQHGLTLDYMYFHMMHALIEHQFALANERNNSLPTFLNQLQLTNILTGMFDQSTRSVPIPLWR